MGESGGSLPWVSPHFERAVRERAYLLWEQEGRPEEREHEFWFRALEQCLHEAEALKSGASDLAVASRTPSEGNDANATR